MPDSNRSCTVVHVVDVYHARIAVRRFAESVGASPREAAELEIVASELAWNIVRHVGSGRLEVCLECGSENERSVSIRAQDPGPPLDLNLVSQDGWSRDGMIAPDRQLGRHGIGCGLGAVKRLSTRFEQIPDANGKTLIATRVLKPR